MNLITFSNAGFRRWMKLILKDMADYITTQLYRGILRNLNQIEYSTKPIRIAPYTGGKSDASEYTSDIKRKTALIRSVIKYDPTVLLDKALIRVAAMGINYKDSHIGYYYEYGTGENEIPNDKKWDKGDPNPFRKTKRIVSRDKKLGPWKDAGGNVRYTPSNEGGRSGEYFRKSITTLRPHRWMGRAIEAMYTKIPKALEIRFNKYNIFGYCLKVNPISVLGGRS
jgi:hypothetical protein